MSRPVVALALEAVFLGAAFGWRSWAQWRRTGRTGFVGVRRGAGAVEVAGAGAFALALVLLVAAPVAALAGPGGPASLHGAWAAGAGAVLAVAGIVLTLVAQVAMGRSWRIGVDPGERTALVTGGPFARVRNPIFTAMLLAAAGLVLLVPNVVSVGAIVVLAVALEVQVRLVEEPYLERTHGADYRRYRARTGRFLPGLGA